MVTDDEWEGERDSVDVVEADGDCDAVDVDVGDREIDGDADAVSEGVSDGLGVYDGVDVSIAVAVEGGLLTPVLRGVDRLSVGPVAPIPSSVLM